MKGLNLAVNTAQQHMLAINDSRVILDLFRELLRGNMDPFPDAEDGPRDH